MPLDGSDQAELALTHAARLARIFAADIHLLHVLTGGRGQADPTDPLAWRLLHAGAQAYLFERAEPLESEGLAVTTEVVAGNAAEAIVEVLRR